jgi:hypothetical protein
MKQRAILIAAYASLAMPVAASTSAYDLLILACDASECKRLVEQTISGGVANMTEYNRSDLKLMIETLARRSNEEDARISLNLGPQNTEGDTWRSVPARLAHRVEALVVQCKLRQGAFSPLPAFVRDGTTYQVWARLGASR